MENNENAVFLRDLRIEDFLGTNRERILEVFRRCNAVWIHSGNSEDPHAELTSGKCSNGYFNCSQVLKRPNINEILALQLVAVLRAEGISNVDYVVGSPYAAITFSYEVAKALGAIHGFTEKDPENPKKMIWKRTQIPAGAIVLQIEELITTSGTFKEVRRAVIEGNTEVVEFLPVVGTLVHRPSSSPTTYEIDQTEIDIISVIEQEVWAIDQTECPLCAQGSERYPPKSHWKELTGNK